MSRRSQDQESEDVIEVFQSAIVNLESLLGAIDAGGEELVAASLWIPPTAVRFFELARERTPLALVILAHYCNAMCCIRDKWWISHWDQRLLAAIYKNLDLDCNPLAVRVHGVLSKCLTKILLNAYYASRGAFIWIEA